MKRIVFVFLFLFLAFSCQKQQPVISGDVMNLYVAIYLMDEEGNNLLKTEFADKPIEAYFRGSLHELRRDVDDEEINSILWKDKAFRDMKWWGLVLVNDSGNDPFLFFGTIASWEKVDDQLVIDWGNGTQDSIYLYNEMVAPDKQGTPNHRRSIIYNDTDYPTGKVVIVHRK